MNNNKGAKAEETILDHVLVSIIIPIYKTEWIDFDQCIRSVTSQTYSNIEIIIVDDGNTTDYAEKLQKYADEDERIRILNKVNEGQGEARNQGVKNAQGEYIFFLDADDYLSPYTIENAVSIAENCSADMVVGGNLHIERGKSVAFFPKEKKRITVSSKEEKDEYINHIIGYRSERFRLSVGGTWDSACYRLIKQEIARQVYFENDKYWDEDDLWNLSIISLCKKIIIVDNLWYACVMSPDSSTRGYKGDRKYEFQFRAKQEYERIKVLWPDCMQGYYHLVWDRLLLYCRTDTFHKGNPRSMGERYKAFKNAINFTEFNEATRNIVFDNDSRLLFKMAKAMLRWLLIHNTKMAFAYLSLCIKMINE